MSATTPLRASARPAGPEGGAGGDGQDRERGQREGAGVDQEGGARRAEEQQQREPTTGPAATAPMPTTARAALAPGRSASGTSRGVVAAAARRVGRGGGRRQAGQERREDDGQPGQRHAGEREHEAGADEVGHDHRPAAVEPVGDHAAQRAEHDDRQHAGGGRRGEPAGAVRPLVDEGQQRDVVEPVPRLRDGEPGEQPAEVAVPQGAAHGPRRRASRPHRRSERTGEPTITMPLQMMS